MSERKPYSDPTSRLMEVFAKNAPAEPSASPIQVMSQGVNLADNLLQEATPQSLSGNGYGMPSLTDVAGVGAQISAGAARLMLGGVAMPSLLRQSAIASQVGEEDWKQLAIIDNPQSHSPDQVAAARNYFSTPEKQGVYADLRTFEQLQKFTDGTFKMADDVRGLADMVSPARQSLGDTVSRDLLTQYKMAEFNKAREANGFFSMDALSALGSATTTGLPTMAQAVIDNPAGAIQEAGYSLAPALIGGAAGASLGKGLGLGAAGVNTLAALGSTVTSLANEPAQAISERLRANVGTTYNPDLVVAGDTTTGVGDLWATGVGHALTETGMNLLTPGLGRIMGMSKGTAGLMAGLKKASGAMSTAEVAARVGLVGATVAGSTVGNMDQEVVQTLLEDQIKGVSSSPAELAQALILGGVGSAPLIAASLPQSLREISPEARGARIADQLRERGVTVDELTANGLLGTRGGDQAVSALANEALVQLSEVDAEIARRQTLADGGEAKTKPVSDTLGSMSDEELLAHQEAVVNKATSLRDSLNNVQAQRLGDLPELPDALVPLATKLGEGSPETGLRILINAMGDAQDIDAALADIADNPGTTPEAIKEQADLAKSLALKKAVIDKVRELAPDVEETFAAVAAQRNQASETGQGITAVAKALDTQLVQRESDTATAVVTDILDSTNPEKAAAKAAKKAEKKAAKAEAKLQKARQAADKGIAKATQKAADLVTTPASADAVSSVDNTAAQPAEDLWLFADENQQEDTPLSSEQVTTLNENLRKMDSQSIAKLLEDEASAATILSVIDRLDPSVKARFSTQMNLGTQAQNRGSSIDETSRIAALGNEGGIGTLQYYDTLVSTLYGKNFQRSGFYDKERLFFRWLAYSKARTAALENAYEKVKADSSSTILVSRNKAGGFVLRTITRKEMLDAGFANWADYRAANPAEDGREWYVHTNSGRLINAAKKDLSMLEALAPFWGKVEAAAKGKLTPDEETQLRKEMAQMGKNFPEFDGLTDTAGELTGSKFVSGRKLIATRKNVLQAHSTALKGYLNAKTPTQVIDGLKALLRAYADMSGMGEALNAIGIQDLKWASRYLGSREGKLRLVGALVTAQILLGKEQVTAKNLAEVLAKARQIVGTRPLLTLSRGVDKFLGILPVQKEVITSTATEAAPAAEQPKAETKVAVEAPRAEAPQPVKEAPKKSTGRASKAADAVVDTNALVPGETPVETAPEQVAVVENTGWAAFVGAIAATDAWKGLMKALMKQVEGLETHALKEAVKFQEWRNALAAPQTEGRETLGAILSPNMNSGDGAAFAYTKAAEKAGMLSSAQGLMGVLQANEGKYRPVIFATMPGASRFKGEDAAAYAAAVDEFKEALWELVNTHDAIVILDSENNAKSKHNTQSEGVVFDHFTAKISDQLETEEPLDHYVVGKPIVFDANAHAGTGSHLQEMVNGILSRKSTAKISVVDLLAYPIGQVWQRVPQAEIASQVVAAPSTDPANNLGLDMAQNVEGVRSPDLPTLSQLFSFTEKAAGKWAQTADAVSTFFSNWGTTLGLLSRYDAAYPGSAAYEEANNRAGKSSLAIDLVRVQSSLESAYALLESTYTPEVKTENEVTTYLKKGVLSRSNALHAVAFWEIFGKKKDGDSAGSAELLPAVRQAMAVALVKFMDRTRGEALAISEDSKIDTLVQNQFGGNAAYANVDPAVRELFRQGSFLQEALEKNLGDAAYEALGWQLGEEAKESTEASFKAFLGAIMLDILAENKVLTVSKYKVELAATDDGGQFISLYMDAGQKKAAGKGNAANMRTLSLVSFDKPITYSSNGAELVEALAHNNALTNLYLQVFNNISAPLAVVQDSLEESSVPTPMPKRIQEERTLSVFMGVRQKVATKIMKVLGAMNRAPRYVNTDMLGPLQAIFAGLDLSTDRNAETEGTRVLRTILGGTPQTYEMFPPVIQGSLKTSDTGRLKAFLELMHWNNGRQDKAAPVYFSHVPWGNDRSEVATRVGNPSSKVNRVLMRPGSKNANKAAAQVAKAGEALHAANKQLHKALEARKPVQAALAEEKAIAEGSSEKLKELSKQMTALNGDVKAAKEAKAMAAKRLAMAQETLKAVSGMPTYDLTNTKDVWALLAGMANGADIGIDKKAQAIAINALLDKLGMGSLDTEGGYTFAQDAAYADTAYMRAIQKLQEYYANPGASIPMEDAQTIADAVAGINNGLQGFQVLANMAKILNAVSKDETTVSLYQISEVDGVANGPSLAQMFYATVGNMTSVKDTIYRLTEDFFEDTANNPREELYQWAEGQMSQDTWLSRAGFFTNSFLDSVSLTSGDYNQYRGRPGVKDTYEFLGEFAMRLAVLMLQRDLDDADIEFRVKTAAVRLHWIMRAWGIPGAATLKPPAKFNTAKEIKQYIADVATLTKHSSVTKKARTLLKNPITQSHYGAADNTLQRNISSTLLMDILTEYGVEKAKPESDERDARLAELTASYNYFTGNTTELSKVKFISSKQLNLANSAITWAIGAAVTDTLAAVMPGIARTSTAIAGSLNGAHMLAARVQEEAATKLRQNDTYAMSLKDANALWQAMTPLFPSLQSASAESKTDGSILAKPKKLVIPKTEYQYKVHGNGYNSYRALTGNSDGLVYAGAPRLGGIGVSLVATSIINQDAFISHDALLDSEDGTIAEPFFNNHDSHFGEAKDIPEQTKKLNASTLKALESHDVLATNLDAALDSLENSLAYLKANLSEDASTILEGALQTAIVPDSPNKAPAGAMVFMALGVSRDLLDSVAIIADSVRNELLQTITLADIQKLLADTGLAIPENVQELLGTALPKLDQIRQYPLEGASGVVLGLAAVYAQLTALNNARMAAADYRRTAVEDMKYVSQYAYEGGAYEATNTPVATQTADTYTKRIETLVSGMAKVVAKVDTTTPTLDPLARIEAQVAPVPEVTLEETAEPITEEEVEGIPEWETSQKDVESLVSAYASKFQKAVEAGLASLQIIGDNLAKTLSVELQSQLLELLESPSAPRAFMGQVYGDALVGGAAGFSPELNSWLDAQGIPRAELLAEIQAVSANPAEDLYSIWLPGQNVILIHTPAKALATVEAQNMAALHEAAHAFTEKAFEWAGQQKGKKEFAEVTRAMEVLQAAAAKIKEAASTRQSDSVTGVAAGNAQLASANAQINPEGRPTDLFELVSWSLSSPAVAKFLNGVAGTVTRVFTAMQTILTGFLTPKASKLKTGKATATQLSDVLMAVLTIRSTYVAQENMPTLQLTGLRQMYSTPTIEENFANVLTEGLLAEQHSPVYVDRMRTLVSNVTSRVFRKAFTNPKVVAQLKARLAITNPQVSGFRQDSVANMLEQSSNLMATQGELVAVNQLEMAIRQLLNDKTSGYQFRRLLEQLQANALKQYPTAAKMQEVLQGATPADMARVKALHAMLFESASTDHGGALLARFAALVTGYSYAEQFFHYTPEVKGDGKTFLQKIIQAIGRVLTWFEAKDRVLELDGSAVNQMTEVLQEMAANQLAYRRWLKKGDGRITKWLDAHADVGSRVGQFITNTKWVRKSKYSPIRLAGSLYRIYQSGDFQKYLDVLRVARDSHSSKEDHGLLMKTLTEIRGVLPGAEKVFSLFRQIRVLENNRQDTLRDASEAAISAFKAGKALKPAERKAVLAIALRTGFWKVGEVLTDEELSRRLERYTADQKALDADIAQLGNTIQGMLTVPGVEAATAVQAAGFIKGMAERFGHFWATGEVRGSMPTLNVNAMLKGLLRRQGYKKVALDAQLLEHVEALAALYATKSAFVDMSAKEMTTLKELLAVENGRANAEDSGNGFEYVIAQHKIFEQRSQALYQNVEGDFAEQAYQDNWLPDLVDPRIEIAWDSERNLNGKFRTEDGYEVLPIALDAGTYVRGGAKARMVPLRTKSGAPARYTSGILLRGRTQLRGTEYQAGTRAAEANEWANFFAEVSSGVPMIKQARNSLTGVKGGSLQNSDNGFVKRGMLSFVEQSKYQNAQEDFAETLGAYASKLFEKEEMDTVAADMVVSINAYARKEFKAVGVNMDTLLDKDAAGNFVYAKDLEKVRKSWVLVSNMQPSNSSQNWLMERQADYYRMPQVAFSKEDHVWVRKDMVGVVLGRDQFSLSKQLFKQQEFANDAEGRKLLKAIGDNLARFLASHKGISKETAQQVAYNWMRHKGRITREIVALIKDVIVIRTMAVYLFNTLSNLYHLKNLGVPWKTIVRGYVLGHQAATQYRRDFAEMEQLAYQIDTGVSREPIEVLKRKHALLRSRLDSNPVREYIEQGMLPSIVEDISITESSMFSDRVEWQKQVEDRIPKIIRPALTNMLVLPGSTTYHAANSLTQLSDFAARVAYMEHLREIRDSRSMDEKVLTVMEEFVWYDLPQSAEVEWANQVGLLMFTKYFVRIQKVLFKLLREHPLRTMGLGLFDSFVLDMPNPMESLAPLKDFGLDYLGYGPLEIGTVLTQPGPVDALF